MTHVYPNADPCHEVDIGYLSQTYKGFAQGILMSGDIQAIEYCIETLFSKDHINNEDAQDLAEILSSVVDKAKSKMAGLHGFLGAYGIDGDGHLTKPDSERNIGDHEAIAKSLIDSLKQRHSDR